MSSTVHVDDKKKGLILGGGPTQGLSGTTITPENLLILMRLERNSVQACIIMQ